MPREMAVAFLNFAAMALLEGMNIAKELCLEAMKMKHCVSSYAKGCRDGAYRVFSIRETGSEKRVATVGLRFKDSFWALDQVKGKANRKAGSELESLSNSLARFYQQTHLQYSSRPIAPANGESNIVKVRGDGFFT